MTREEPNLNYLADGETILSAEEALPCPFCGYQPTIQPWHGGSPTKHMVACADELYEAIVCPTSPSCSGETRAEAIAKWNTRVKVPR